MISQDKSCNKNEILKKSEEIKEFLNQSINQDTNVGVVLVTLFELNYVIDKKVLPYKYFKFHNNKNNNNKNNIIILFLKNKEPELYGIAKMNSKQRPDIIVKSFHSLDKKWESVIKISFICKFDHQVIISRQHKDLKKLISHYREFSWLNTLQKEKMFKLLLQTLSFISANFSE